MSFRQSSVALALCALVVACGASDPLSSVASPPDDDGSFQPPSTEGAPLVPVSASREGTVYRQEIVSPIGDTVIFQVMEPTNLEAGKTYPLVLQGHGYGGHRDVAPNEFQQRLRDTGYYVVSIDQRGFGESTGTIRVMDPEYEGVNLTAILDWAENLEGLRRHLDGRMVVGSYGGSYGGMYQVLLWAADPQHRLRVLAPDITPHDLVYALDPNNVVKSGWGLVLSAGGEGAVALQFADGFPLVVAPTGLHQDPAIYETLLQAVTTNAFSDASKSFFRYHSFKYYCDGQAVAPQNFLVATPDALTQPPTLPPAADVLITQGMRDTLFNFNDGWNNYQCMKALGGDVRLLTHQSGHILPVELPADAKDAIDAFYQALTIPGFQAGGGSRTCGDLDLDDLTFAWFEEKLRNQPGAVAAVVGDNSRNVCMSLAEGEAVELSEDSMKVASASFPIDSSTPQFNAVLGTITSLAGTAAREALLADQVLLTVPAGGLILAGIPKLDVEVAGLSGTEMGECLVPELTAACDPILLLAIGHRAPGQTRWDIVDDELTPMRGFGTHQLDMTGISGRFAEGEEIALLIYGFHAQFPVTWSRDVFVPAVNLTGTLALPVRPESEILRTRLVSPES
jgi:ABC-2 type transport system ATP-binding protein